MSRQELRHVVSKDGTEIACHVSGDGPPLVLVYGALSDSGYWVRLAPFFVGYSLYVMERRGRGASGDSAAYATGREVEDIIAVIESVGEPVYLFGHSAGAVLAFAAAQQIPDRVRRIALYEPPFVTAAGLRENVDPGLPDRLRQMVAAGQAALVIETFFRLAPGLTEQEIERQKGGQLWQSLEHLAHTAPYDVQVGIDFDLQRMTGGDFNVPALLIYGELSPPWMTGGVRALAAALGSVSLVMLEGQGHAAAFTAPGLLAAAVRQFFEVAD